MIKLTDILKEGKQYPILYHFTRMTKAIKILESNVLKTAKWEGEEAISLTRNYQLGMLFGDVRFAIDGERLSYNYKISPHLSPEYDAFSKDYDYYDKGRRREQEERVYRNIKNFTDYLVQIDIYYDYETDKHTTTANELREAIPNQIPYNFVEDWKPVRI